MTDVQVREILSLKKIRLENWQIAKLTGVKPAQVKRICNAKAFKPKRKYPLFNWEDYNNSIV